MWMVRAGEGGELVEEFIDRGVIALGGPELGPLSPHATKNELLELFAKHFPNEKPGTRGVWASQALRFLTEMQQGDYALTYDPDRRVYLLGTIKSDYEFLPNQIESMPHARRVEWTHEVLRDTLSVPTRNSLGAIAALFLVPPDAAAEIEGKKAPIGTGEKEPVPPKPAKDAKNGSGITELGNETISKADTFIQDAINLLDWSEMQDLVAGILRAMGYRTTVAPSGADRGVDIMASPDGLMLQEPRIFVEVKHRTKAQMSAKEIRAFLGGRKPGDRCLYISTGGFTKDAHYEADRSSVPITLVNIERLAKLLVDHYDRLDAETRALVPLKKLYWPIEA